MRSTSAEAMESGGDYDLMLRGMFESCDTVGLGLLTPSDFELLCSKLSMQEHTSLLTEVLFSNRNQRKLLSYETFRDTLILFLTGDPEFAERATDCGNEPEPETENTPELRDANDNWNSSLSDEDIENRLRSPDTDRSISPDDNRFYQSPDENRFYQSPDENRFGGYREEQFAAEPDFGLNEESCDNNRALNYARTYSENNRKHTKTATSPGKYRRYGRKSKPDMELLRNRKDGNADRPVVLREVQMDNNKQHGKPDENLPENSPWKAVEVSFVNREPATPIAMKEEEFTGEGNDEVWRNPDSEWTNDNEKERESAADRSVEAAQSVLESVWRRVIGDPLVDAMDETQLCFLCTELGMGAQLSSDAEISQLFAALDQDCDGLVTFSEFSEQMSVFLGCDAQTEDANNGNSPDSLRDAKLDDSWCDDMNESRERVFTNSVIIEENEDVVDDTDRVMTSSSDAFCQMTSTPTSSTVSMSSTPALVIDTPESACDSQPARRATLESGSDPASPSASFATSEESRTPTNRGRLSIDEDTSPLCPPVVPVEPRQLAAINRGRRRRRSSAVAASNPAGVRPQRRKSSRSIPLPHYHPASLRRLDELPLSYLTEENERYVGLDSLRQYWQQDGIDNPSDVFEALQVPSTDETVSVEALSEVIDMELEQNIIQRAALILYKRGINHYRGHFEHERAERAKLESNIEHLMAQLHEQEERMENVETKLECQTEDIESKFKAEIRRLTDDLNAAQATIKQHELQSNARREEEYNDLLENYEKSQALAEEIKSENERLCKEKDEIELRLQDAEEAMLRMREDLDAACRGMALFSREHATQRKQLADVMRMFEVNAQSVQDHNDELLDRLQHSKKKWTPSRSRSPNKRSRTSLSSYKSSASPLLRQSDTSSYSSASSMTSDDASSHHLSTCHLFVGDSPSHADTPSHFRTPSPSGMTSTPHDSPQNGINGAETRDIMTPSAFAFLTPSTSRAKARVIGSGELDPNTSLSLMPPPPPISSDC